jgi:YHS domain-containing protein
MLLTRFILYVLIVLVLARALRRFFAGFAQGLGGRSAPSRRIDEGVRMVRDPICGTFVIPAGALVLRDAAGVHHFCSDKCRDAFVARTRRVT